MFFVFNKEKIYSYLVVASTVMVLFFTGSILCNNKIETTQTSSNMIKKNQIYSKEKNIKNELPTNCMFYEDE